MGRDSCSLPEDNLSYCSGFRIIEQPVLEASGNLPPNRLSKVPQNSRMSMQFGQKASSRACAECIKSK